MAQAALHKPENSPRNSYQILEEKANESKQAEAFAADRLANPDLWPEGSNVRRYLTLSHKVKEVAHGEAFGMFVFGCIIIAGVLVSKAPCP